MPLRRRPQILGIAAAISLVAIAALPSGLAVAAPPKTPPPSPASDTLHVGPDLNGGKPVPVHASNARARERSAQQRTEAQASAAPGEVRTWLGLNYVEGAFYPKDYALRGIGEHIQVWVAENRAFPAGDCRNDLGLTEITDAQVASFISEFDSNIYPKESQAFSVPPSRTGADAALPELLDLPADYYQVTADQADDIVVLVDNVRDANYFEPVSPEGQTYVAGFFSSTLNELTDRNVMSIDAFDWLHRTGANPPDDSTDPAYVACSASHNRAANRGYGRPDPRAYEATFAHEYQHLLEYYEDADEVSWVNEGLSDYAQTLVGYVDTSIPPDQPGAT